MGFNLLQPAAIGNTQVAAMLLEKGFPINTQRTVGAGHDARRSPTLRNRVDQWVQQ